MSFLFPVHRKGRTFTIFAVAPILLGLLGVSLWSQTIETERWPVPMRVDREQIPTGMIVEMNFERIEKPLAAFEDEGDPDKQIMNAFVNSILAGNVDEAINLTADVPGTVRENARDLLQAFSSLLDGKSESLQLDRIVHQGSDRLLIWSIPNGPERYYRSFRFVRDNNQSLAYEGLLTEPISSLLTNVLQVGQSVGPLEENATDLEYEYTLPGTEDSPVTFHFDGLEIDVNSFAPGGSTQNEVVDFYNASIDALANGTPVQLAAFYSAFSAGRYIDWATNQGDLAYEAFRADMVEYGSRVVFLLDADPMYLVFFTPGNPDVQGDPIRYVSIYDDPKSGLQLTNFYIEGLTETFLKKNEYFEEPFLRPLLIASGTISNERLPESTIATNGETEYPDSQELSALTDQLLQESNPKPDPKPKFSNIEDIAGDEPVWPWILGAFAILAIAALVLSQRKRNK